MLLSSALEFVNCYGLQLLQEGNAGIEAIAVGSKDTGPLETSTEFSVTAYVREKRTERDLERASVRSFSALVQDASEDKGLFSRSDIDVVECGSAFEVQDSIRVAAAQRGVHGGPIPDFNSQREFQELRAGIGITNPVGAYPNGLSVGTLGFFVVDEETDEHFLVSNNHVIGGSNAATVGDAIVQPGTLDLTASELQLMPTEAALVQRLGIAELDTIVPLQFQSPKSTPHNTVDAAMARLTGTQRGRSHLHQVCFAGSVRGVASPYTVDQDGALSGSGLVYKAGRTTGMTEGSVIGIGGVATIPYPTGNAYFHNQLVIRATPDNGGPFSAPGDSGSGILNNRHELVGLLYAGSKQQTLANPIDLVLNELRQASGRSQLQVVHA